MTPVEPGRTHWYAAVPEATTAEEVRSAFAGWHDPVPRVLADTDPAGWIRYEMRHLHPALPSFTAGGRIALVGDAAHAMTPTSGRGPAPPSSTPRPSPAPSPPGRARTACPPPCARTTPSAAAARSAWPSPPGPCTAS